jgi:hypothetical protein
MSVSDCGSIAMIKWGGFVIFCDSPEITTVCNWRKSSKIASHQEEQSAVGNIDGQLKVGPTRRLWALLPATYGESVTSVIILHCHEWRNRSTLIEFTFHVSIKIVIWSFDLMKVLHTEILTDLTINLFGTNWYIRLKLHLLTLDITVTRHQATLH